MKTANIDIIRLNHWLNARKITLPILKNKNKNLYKKIKLNKNFLATNKELRFLTSFLNIQTEDIITKLKLADYIYFSKKKFFRLKDQLKEMEYIFTIITHCHLLKDLKLQ